MYRRSAMFLYTSDNGTCRMRSKNDISLAGGRCIYNVVNYIFYDVLRLGREGSGHFSLFLFVHYIVYLYRYFLIYSRTRA